MTQESIETLVRERVDVALANRFRCELANPGTGQPFSREERRQALTVLFTELVKGMGIERFLETPVERLDQFAVMSLVKNHDTAGLLRSLVNSFMIAYACPETADRAFAALKEIEALRAFVADVKGQKTQNPILAAAVTALDAVLRQRLPNQSSEQPSYRILVGADRLFVMAPKPIDDLPTEINGVPVEVLADLMATTH